MYLMNEYLCEPLASGEQVFGEEQWLSAMLTFESALASAQAECGLIPESAASDIARACAEVHLNRNRFVEQSRQSGAVGLGLTKPLRQWLVDNAPESVPWLHWGTTTQDVVDTAHALLTRDALNALDAEIDALCAVLERMASEHAATPMLARTLLQPAQITSFGLKCVQAALALRRSQSQLRVLAASALCVQIGGAVGNRAAFGASGAEVEQALARRLGLAAPGHAWHTQRDTWVRLGLEVAVCAGSIAKLAKDWSLLSQFEVGEVGEAERGSTSSAMPHKRNPVHCMQVIALTQAVPHIAGLLLSCMPQAHERALGEWQAEVAHWASLWSQTIGACRSLHLAAQGLNVSKQHMQRNLDALQQLNFSEGFVQALSKFIASTDASRLVSEQSDVAIAKSVPLGTLLQDAIKPLCSAEDLPKVRSALQEVADLRHAVSASERACRAILQQCAQIRESH